MAALPSSPPPVFVKVADGNFRTATATSCAACNVRYTWLKQQPSLAGALIIFPDSCPNCSTSSTFTPLDPNENALIKIITTLFKQKQELYNEFMSLQQQQADTRQIVQMMDNQIRDLSCQETVERQSLVNTIKILDTEIQVLNAEIQKKDQTIAHLQQTLPSAASSSSRVSNKDFLKLNGWGKLDTKLNEIPIFYLDISLTRDQISTIYQYLTYDFKLTSIKTLPDLFRLLHEYDPGLKLAHVVYFLSKMRLNSTILEFKLNLQDGVDDYSPAIQQEIKERYYIPG